MAYADRSDSGNKVVAIIIVAIIHAVIGYAFVTGLAFQYVKKVSEKLNTFDVAPPPPPPPPDEPPPPPPPDTPLTPPPVVSPPPIVRNPNPPPQQVVTVSTPPAVYNPTPIAAPPAPPAPAPVVSRVSQAASAKGNEADWITADDYPPRALSEEKEGTSVIGWTINAQGRIENCRTIRSSGSTDLDETACRVLTKRARYTPAKDQNGNPIATTKQRSVRWVVPK